jgi:hypothetical protein
MYPFIRVFSSTFWHRMGTIQKIKIDIFTTARTLNIMYFTFYVTQNRSENGRGARAAFCANAAHTHTFYVNTEAGQFFFYKLRL